MTSQRIFMVYTNHIASRRLEGFLVNLCHPLPTAAGSVGLCTLIQGLNQV